MKHAAVSSFHPIMGIKNYLIEGISGSGKSSVGDELRCRGYHVIHGDRELAYQGDPQTGELRGGFAHENHIWNVEKVRTLAADRSWPMSFFCGGSRNFHRFVCLFDRVFVLEIDRETLDRRLAARGCDEFGGSPEERNLIARLHATQEDVPRDALKIDATAPIDRVVDEILSRI